LRSDNLYPAARAIAAVIRGGPVNLESLSIEEEAGFLLLASALRNLGRTG
jgi:hypothetical protein